MRNNIGPSRFHAAFLACALAVLLVVGLIPTAAAQAEPVTHDAGQYQLNVTTRVAYDTVEIKAVDATTGMFLQGVSVEVMNPTSQPPAPFGQLITNVSGVAYQEGLSANTTYQVKVAKPGYEVLGSANTTLAPGTMLEYTFTGDALKQTWTVKLRPTAPIDPLTSVSVSVFDNDTKAPLQNASISVDQVGTQLSNAQGTATFHPLKTGDTYQVSVSMPGYKPINQIGHVADGAPLYVYLEKVKLVSGTVEVFSQDAQGNLTALEGAKVSVREQGEQITPASGKVAFDSLEMGKSYTVSVSKAGYASVSTEYVADGLSLVVVLNAPVAPVEPNKAAVSVLVLDDSDSNALVEGALVEIYDGDTKVAQAYTTAQGTVRFADLELNKGYRLVVNKKEYKPFVCSGVVGDTPVTVVLQRPSELPKWEMPVLAVNADGQPMSGVTIQVERDGTTHSATTGPDGRVVVPNREQGQVYNVRATLKDYKSYECTYIADGSQLTVVMHKPYVAPKVSANVQVLSDETNSPLAGVSLTLTGQGEPDVQNTTDANGKAKFDNLIEGKTYQVSASFAGYLDASTTFVAAASTEDVVLRMQKPAPVPTTQLLLKVVDSQGNPLSGVAVEVVGIGTGTTDANGCATFDGLEIGKTYRIKAARDGYVSVESNYVANGAPLTLAMQKAGGGGGGGGGEGGGSGTGTGGGSGGGNTPIVNGPGGLSVTGDQLAGAVGVVGIAALIAAIVLIVATRRRKHQNNEER